VFASVGNYLKLHGWQTGEPVMVAADVREARLEGLELGTLELAETVGSLRERGVRFDAGLPADAGAVLIELAGSAGPEYRVGFANFYAITRYNRSALYASAVNDLAEAVAAAPAPDPLTPPTPLEAAPILTSTSDPDAPPAMDTAPATAQASPAEPQGPVTPLQQLLNLTTARCS